MEFKTNRGKKKEENLGWASLGNIQGLDTLAKCGYDYGAYSDKVLRSWGFDDEKIRQLREDYQQCKSKHKPKVAYKHVSNCYPDFREYPDYIPGETANEYEFEVKDGEKTCRLRKKNLKHVSFNHHSHIPGDAHKNGIPTPYGPYNDDDNCDLQGMQAAGVYGNGVNNVVRNYLHLYHYDVFHDALCGDRFLLKGEREWFVASDRIVVHDDGAYARPCKCENVHSRCTDRDCKIDDKVMWTYCNCNTGQKIAIKKVRWGKAGNGKVCNIKGKEFPELKTGDIIPVNPDTGKVEFESDGRYKKFFHACFGKEIQECNMHHFCTQDQFNFDNEPKCREMAKRGYDETKSNEYKSDMIGPKMSDKNSFKEWKSNAIRSYCEKVKQNRKNITKNVGYDECACLNSSSEDPDTNANTQLNNLWAYGGNRCVPEFTDNCEGEYVQPHVRNGEVIRVKKNLYPLDKLDKICWGTIECSAGVNFENSDQIAYDESTINNYVQNSCVQVTNTQQGGGGKSADTSNPGRRREGKPSNVQDPAESQLLSADTLQECAEKTLNKGSKAFVFRNEAFAQKPNTCYAISADNLNSSSFDTTNTHTTYCADRDYKITENCKSLSQLTKEQAAVVASVNDSGNVTETVTETGTVTETELDSESDDDDDDDEEEAKKKKTIMMIMIGLAVLVLLMMVMMK